MPESKKRRKVADKEREYAKRAQNPEEDLKKQSPSWWAPLMVGLAIVGLIVVVTVYVTNGAFPIPVCQTEISTCSSESV